MIKKYVSLCTLFIVTVCTSFLLFACNEEFVRKTVSDILNPGVPSGQSHEAQSLPRIIDFSAERYFINPGETVTLRWKVENADTVEISGIGSVALQGSRSVSPGVSQTYTLVAKNRAGQSSASAGGSWEGKPSSVSSGVQIKVGPSLMPPTDQKKLEPKTPIKTRENPQVIKPMILR